MGKKRNNRNGELLYKIKNMRVPSTVMNDTSLSQGARLMFGLLLDRARGFDRPVSDTEDYLGLRLGRTGDSARRYLNELLERNYIFAKTRKTKTIKYEKKHMIKKYGKEREIFYTDYYVPCYEYYLNHDFRNNTLYEGETDIKKISKILKEKLPFGPIVPDKTSKYWQETPYAHFCGENETPYAHFCGDTIGSNMSLDHRLKYEPQPYAQKCAHETIETKETVHETEDASDEAEKNKNTSGEEFGNRCQGIVTFDKILNRTDLFQQYCEQCSDIESCAQSSGYSYDSGSNSWILDPGYSNMV
jgi:hypothetical protein